MVCCVTCQRSRSDCAPSCALCTVAVTSSMRFSTNATMPGAGSSAARSAAVKPSRSQLCSTLLSWLTASKPQWWLVTSSPSADTNDAVQPLICTVADSTPPRSGCQNSSLVMRMPRFCSASQSQSRTWVGSHWPSSGSRATASANRTTVRAIMARIRGGRAAKWARARILGAAAAGGRPLRYSGGMVRLAALSVLLLALAPAAAQNSTRKLRAAPSALAETAGNAVHWAESLDAALATARAQGKPVFWYVPTVAGSPMDRRPEIDRYLLAGPFSWPSTIDLLNDRFVPVREVPRGEVQRRYRLQRGEFIEPGWLVLDGDEKERARLQQLTTFQPQWFEAPLRRLAGVPAGGFPCTPALQDAWTAYRSGDAAACDQLLQAVLDREPAPGVGAEALFLRGALQRRSGRDQEANTTWRALGDRFPATTWAAKAAMEAEGHGPFTHGFEDFLPVPERVLRDLDEGSRAPRGTFTEAELWLNGVRFLLRLADGDGLLRDSIYDFGGTDSLPNVHLAVSCLAGLALLEAAQRSDDGRLALPAELRGALDRRLDELLAAAAGRGPLARDDRDEILWAHAYRARFLARWAQLRSGDRDRLAAPLRSAVGDLCALQPETGVWFHEYGNPFAIATALLALADARACGIAIDDKVIARGLAALVQCRAASGAYSYNHPGDRPPRADVAAAAGRMPLCELALLRWEKSDQDALQRALNAAFEHHGKLAAVRKYDDHADRLGYGGFFFWFDMLGRAEATMQVADAVPRGVWQAQQKKLVLDLPEFDGCFVDSHELGRAYGTAMALLCLAVLEPRP